jgi:type II secretory pathway component PulF
VIFLIFDFFFSIVFFFYLLNFLLERRNDCNYLLTRLESLLKSGTPLFDAVNDIASELAFHSDPIFRVNPLREALLKETIPKLKAGKSLAESLKGIRILPPIPIIILALIFFQITFLFLYTPFSQNLFSSIFTESTLDAIAFGEKNGCLVEILYFLQKKEAIKNAEVRVSENAEPDIIRLGIGFMALLMAATFLNLYIIPSFITLLKSSSIQVPRVTILTSAINSLIGNHIVLFGIMILLIPAVLRIYWGELLIQLPVLNQPLLYKEYALLTESLAAGIEKNVPLPESLLFSARVANTRLFRTRILKGVEDLKKGKSLSESFQKWKIVSPFIIWMTAFGEASQNLPAVLREIAVYYEEQIPLCWNKTVEIFSVFFTVCLGIFVVVYALDFWMPVTAFYGTLLVRIPYVR